MHIHTLSQWQHTHNFSDHQGRAEKNTKIAMVLTATTMIAEVIAGTIFGSMALLADGWHMATHVAAFGITMFAYRYARKHAANPRYTFGTGKVSVLGGFASAVALAVVAFLMAVESTERFFQPHFIRVDEAIGVAILGLIVNAVSVWLLHEAHDHSHHQHDQNLRAAYFHVLADTLTSILAIAALIAGKFLGWFWLDALMGVVGAIVISKWAYGLVQETSSILLDGAVDTSLKLDITTAIETDADNRITDLHVWYLDPDHLSAMISLVTHYPQTPEYYKKLLAHIPSLSHVLIEIHACPGPSCIEVPLSQGIGINP